MQLQLFTNEFSLVAFVGVVKRRYTHNSQLSLNQSEATTQGEAAPCSAELMGFPQAPAN